MPACRSARFELPTLRRRRRRVDPRLGWAIDALLRDLRAPADRSATPAPATVRAPAKPSQARGPRRRSSRLGTRSTASLALLGLIALGAMGALAAASRLHTAPAWWRSVRADAPETTLLGTRVERAVLHHVNTPRPLGQPWTVSVTIEQANAWLATRLPLWAENRSDPLPEPVRQVQASFDAGRVTLGALLELDSARQIVAATFTPAIHADGSLWLEDLGATAGRLDLPRDWTIARLREWLPERLRSRRSASVMLGALAGQAPLFPDASISLDDGVRVRLLDVRVVDSDLILTCVNEREGADLRALAP